MSEGYKIRSLSEIVNEILSTVRSYYDAEYAYYTLVQGTGSQAQV